MKVRLVIALPIVPSPNTDEQHFFSPFLIANKSNLMVFNVAGIAFGIGVLLLLGALEWIQLGRFPLSAIIENSFNPKAGRS